MPSPTRGVPITLDKKRHLRYPLGVLHDIEADTPLDEVLYLGLKHEDEELTVEQVGDMIDLEMMPDLADPIRRATGGLVKVHLLFGLDGSEGGAEGNGAGPQKGG